MSGTYEPELYDVITPPQFLGDVDWYRSRAVEAAGPVLELGAGTGRITIPIAEAGVEIHARACYSVCVPNSVHWIQMSETG